MADARLQELERQNRHLERVVELQRREIAALRELLAERDARIRCLEEQVEELTEALQKLGAKVSLSTHSGQKATYAKDRENERKKREGKDQEETPKKKGRAEGAEGSTRKRLTEEDVEETRHVPDTGCPHCGRNLSHVVIQSQIYETVIPAERRHGRIFDLGLSV